MILRILSPMKNRRKGVNKMKIIENRLNQKYHHSNGYFKFSHEDDDRIIYDYKILASNGTCIHYGIISVNKEDKRKTRIIEFK